MWEWQQGGERVADLGICPACTSTKSDGLNGGRSGGRICWALTGTLCGGKVQGIFAQKLANCMRCDFYQLVHTEQGARVESFSSLQARK